MKTPKLPSLKLSKINPRLLIIIGIILLSFIVGAYFYPYLPTYMATHWNIAGEVDGHMPKLYALGIMPLISLFMFIFYLIIPKIPVMNVNLDQFRRQFDNFMIVLFSFLLYIYLLTILWNLNVQFNMIQLLSPAFALLFIVCGNLIGKAKQNPLIGIRTPWTLNNEKTWDKTHKVGALCFQITGVFSLFGILFPDLAIWFILIPVLFTVIFTVVYSWLVYQEEKKKTVKSK